MEKHASQNTIPAGDRKWVIAFNLLLCTVLIFGARLVFRIDNPGFEQFMALSLLAAACVGLMLIHFAAVRHLRRATENLRSLIAIDDVTGLVLRKPFEDRLALELARTQRSGAPTSIILLQCDQPVTDDENVRRLFGGVLRNSLRDLDLAAHFDANRFVLLLGETEEAGARVVAKRIQDAIRRDVAVMRNLTLSVGLASTRTIGGDAQELISAAQFAVASATADGPGNICVATSNDTSLRANHIQQGPARVDAR
jgi:diguanylate cyclase (GGDEF)-like protein